MGYVFIECAWVITHKVGVGVWVPGVVFPHKNNFGSYAYELVVLCSKYEIFIYFGGFSYLGDCHVFED
jgi:hypothetical protein